METENIVKLTGEEHTALESGFIMIFIDQILSVVINGFLTNSQQSENVDNTSVDENRLL